MKITLIKATYSFGIAKTGKPFEMASAVALIPVELVEGDKYTCRGGGHTPYVYDVADNFAAELAQSFARDIQQSEDGITVVYDLDAMPRERGNNVILGFSGQPASASAPVETTQQPTMPDTPAPVETTQQPTPPRQPPRPSAAIPPVTPAAPPKVVVS
jgi:hypothetical protein